MKFFNCLLLLGLAIVATGQDSDVNETIEEFEEEFGVRTNDKELEKEWAENLKKAEKEINEQNEKYRNGESTFWEGLNEFSELGYDDFEAEKTGLMADDGGEETRSYGLLEMPEEESRRLSEMNADFFDRFAMSRGGLPSSVDSVSANFVTEVKNQGGCGSCAAFAATTLAETCMLKANARRDGLDLSEQDLMDCGYTPEENGPAKGCNGATLPHYQQWIVDNAGQLPHEQVGPYTETRKSCANNANYNTGAKVASSKYTHWCSEEIMKGLVAEFGAVTTGVSAYGPFSKYSGGIFDGCDPSAEMDHAVTVVGYGTENGVDFWKVKNSWGKFWGENGYIRVKRGVNMCGIGKYCVVLDCQSSGTPDEPITTTLPPNKSTCDLSKHWSGLNATYVFTWTTSNQGKITSTCSCKNSLCTPQNLGENEDACMRICGARSC